MKIIGKRKIELLTVLLWVYLIVEVICYIIAVYSKFSIDYMGSIGFIFLICSMLLLKCGVRGSENKEIKRTTCGMIGIAISFSIWIVLTILSVYQYTDYNIDIMSLIIVTVFNPIHTYVFFILSLIYLNRAKESNSSTFSVLALIMMILTVARELIKLIVRWNESPGVGVTSLNILSVLGVTVFCLYYFVAFLPSDRVIEKSNRKSSIVEQYMDSVRRQ